MRGECEGRGFIRGPGSFQGTLFAIQDYLPTAQASVNACYRVKYDGLSLEYAILFDDKLLIYIFES